MNAPHYVEVEDQAAVILPLEGERLSISELDRGKLTVDLQAHLQ